MGAFVDYTTGFNLDNSFSNAFLNTSPSGPFTSTQWTLNFSLSGASGTMLLGGLNFQNNGSGYTGTITSFDLTFNGVHHYKLSNLSVSLSAFVDAFAAHSPSALHNLLYAGDDTFDLDNAEQDNGYAMFGGGGKDTFLFHAGWCSTEGGVDGGSGADTLVLNGNYAETIVLKLGLQLSTSSNLIGVETVRLEAGHSYTLEHRGWSGYGVLTIDGSSLGASDELVVLRPISDQYGLYVVQGGAGDDALTGGDNALGDTLSGRSGNDTLSGALGADKLDGGAGADIINGGGHADVIAGGLGKDVLTGGGGADVFVFAAPLRASNADRITDFSVVADTIHLENAVFTALTTTGALGAAAFWKGAAAHDASDRVIYNAVTGALLYDADGNGAGAAVQFATLEAGLNLTANDFVVI